MRLNACTPIICPNVKMTRVAYLLSEQDTGNLGKSDMTSAAIASLVVHRVRAPPPMNNSPRAMLMAM
jgi:hypothetical protein